MEGLDENERYSSFVNYFDVRGNCLVDELHEIDKCSSLADELGVNKGCLLLGKSLTRMWGVLLSQMGLFRMRSVFSS